MSYKTFTTLLPDVLLPFSIVYSEKVGADRDFALELVLSDKSRTKQNQELQRRGYSKRHANSMLIDVKGKYDSAFECHQLHISTLEGKIKSAQEQLETWEEKLITVPVCCDFPRNQYKTNHHRLRFKIHNKKRYIIATERKLERVIKDGFTVNLGPVNNFSLVGSQGESFGNLICQYDGENIKMRTVDDGSNDKYVTAPLKFPYGQDVIEGALLRRGLTSSGNVLKASQGEALTWRIFQNQSNGKWYIAVTLEVTDVPLQSNWVGNGALGVDLNPGVVGICVTDANGNPIYREQFKCKLHSRTQGQIKAELSDIVVKISAIAEKYNVPIVIEDLDFSAKKKRMREEGRRYARMLNYFSYGTFRDVLEARCNNRGIQLIKVNPAYSSLIGLTKFMQLYGMSSDTVAALVIARRAMRCSESIPDHVAFLVPNTRKHVWSSWYRLNQKLKGIRRDSFFNQPSLTANLSGSQRDRLIKVRNAS